MNTAAFIPIYGGSDSILLKNITHIAGEPLVYWTVRAACMCSSIDRVYVVTDNDIISETVDKYKGTEVDLFGKAVVIRCSLESLPDLASTEMVMLEFAQSVNYDTIVLIQSTSSLLRSEDLDRGFAAYEEKGTDSVLSVVRQKRFQWVKDENGYAHPSDYDVSHRPSSREFDGYLVENGAFYITSRKDLLTSKKLVSGNIKAVEMKEYTFFEIDEPADWFIAEALMEEKYGTVPSILSNIRLFLTDCDGCLTDGGMYYSERGDEMKKFNTHDGMAFLMLRERGIMTGIITGENVELNRRRVEKLKIDFYEAGCRDKASAVRKICAEQGIALENVAYIGDDINDLEVLEMVGLGCCPADAVYAVKQKAKYVSSVNGGAGVIRDVAEHVLGKSALI